MTAIIQNLFYMVDEWADRQSMDSPEMKELLARQDALQEEIILRLGGDGREMMEALAALSLELENIRDEALFRTAMRLGTQLAHPRRRRLKAQRPR